jgi:DNA polymerase III subunit epsilon
MTPLYTFNLLHEGQVLLRKMATEFSLHEGLCFIDRSGSNPVAESPADHNTKVQAAIRALQAGLPSFLLRDSNEDGAQYILVEKGRFVGMGPLENEIPLTDIPTIRQKITPYPDNDYIRRLVYQFAEKFPENKIDILL